MNKQQEIELSGILKFGLTYDKLKPFDIICLPENLSTATSQSELYDASDSIILAKHLKAKGVNCANSLDLSFQPQIFERRSSEKWFGVVYLRNNVVVPLFVTVLGTILADQIITTPKSADEPIPKVHIELKIEKQNNITTLKYDGDAETLLKILKNLENER